MAGINRSMIAGLVLCGMWGGVGTPVIAQCTLLVRDTFRLGPRPHGGNGRPRDIVIGESLMGYWPLIPQETQWRTVDVQTAPQWIWSASSLDPLEVDAEDPFNGTAFSGPGNDAALLPFQPPAATGAFTFSVDIAQGQGVDDPIFAGFTSSGAVIDNFSTNGVLWMWVSSNNQWRIYANGQTTLVATGETPMGQLYSGWTRIEVSYDPATSMVSGHMGEASFGPTLVNLTAPISFVGVESHGNFFNAANNLVVRSGTPVTVSASGPSSVCSGATLELVASTNALGLVNVAWTRSGEMILDGTTTFPGSTVSGASTTHLRIENASAGVAGSYRCLVMNECGVFESAAVTVSSCPADFNCDGVLGSGDFFEFLSAFFSLSARADFDHNGVVTSQDFFEFLSAFFAGC